jgi:two-component system, NarL family, sensor histidine kinase EvgS
MLMASGVHAGAPAGVHAQAAEPAGIASLLEDAPSRTNEGTLVIGVTPGVAPPLDMSQAAGRDAPLLRGASIDYAAAVARGLGRAAQWRVYPDRAAMIAALESGEIDMATGATGADPDTHLLLSHAYFPNALAYLEPLTPPARPTHRLAYVDAQISPQRLHEAYPAFEAAPFADMPSALLAVSQGRADALVGAWGSVVYTINDLDLPGLNVKGYAAFDEHGYAFAFAANRPDAAALHAQVDAALAAMPDRFRYFVSERWQAAIAPVTLTRRIALSDEQAAWIRAHPVVHYSMLAYAPPLMFTDSSGAPAGVAVDVLDAIARMTGLRFEARVRSSVAQIRGDLLHGASAFTPYSVLAGGEVTQAVPSTPFGQGVFAIVTRAGAAPLADATALAGRRIALPDEYPGHEYLRKLAPSLRFVDARPFDGQFRAVAKGSADATIVDMASANYAVSNPYRGKLVISGVLSTRPEPQGFIVEKNQAMLLGILNHAIASMPPYELESIRSRWKLARHPEALWERRRPQVELGALLSFVLVLLLAGWALTLRVQINKRIAAEQAMRAAKEEAETANRAKSTFLATMSHEIRTPMNAVLGLLELELRAPGERAATVRSLTTAHHAARDLLGMIDDLLDVAKIEAQRLVLSPAPLDLHAWIASVVAIYEPAARAKGIALKCGVRQKRNMSG